ncbi:inorganic diphosphatase [Citrobacter freundii]|nr:inorganic diphosphatase [Citrobacter freundii]
MFYPCNYGYINHTLSLDGDPVDVLVPDSVPAGARFSDSLPPGWRTENDRRIR